MVWYGIVEFNVPVVTDYAKRPEELTDRQL